MIDYSLADQKISVRDLPDVSAMIRQAASVKWRRIRIFRRRRAVIRDELFFRTWMAQHSRSNS